MTASLSRIFHVVWKEVIQISRDQRMFGLILLMPLMELFIFGYVVATDITDIDLAVCDYDQSAESRAYVDRVVRSGYFRIAAGCRSLGDVNRILDRGTVKVALTIPPDFSARLKRQQPAEVMPPLDARNSNTATTPPRPLGHTTPT